MNKKEDNFESLRQLLALKRHEVPPPGYFNKLSGQVISRISAGEASEPTGAAERLFSEAPWLLKFLQIFEAKPAFAGVFASALCLVLVFGIALSGNSDYSGPQSLLTPNVKDSAPLADVSSPTIAPSSSQILLSSSISNNSSSSLQPVASLFGQQTPFAQQVSFSVPGN